MKRTLRIATRSSALALAQTGMIAEQLERAGERVDLVTVKTAGDRSHAPVEHIGVGVFTSALREALAHGDADVAVHSYKDLPTARDTRFSIAAVPEREDPRDVVVARKGLTLGELPPGATVGTGSPRRAAQLEALGLGLRVLPIRGNIDTRVRKVTEGELDAVVIAKAGLVRTNRLDVITEVLDPLRMLPAPAQGALAVECRVDDIDVEHLLQSVLDDPASRAAVAAERSLLAALEAGCSAPVGALAEVAKDAAVPKDTTDTGVPSDTKPLEPAEQRPPPALTLRGVAATRDNTLLHASATGEMTTAVELGHSLAARLLDLGAAVLGGPRE